MSKGKPKKHQPTIQERYEQAQAARKDWMKRPTKKPKVKKPKKPEIIKVDFDKGVFDMTPGGYIQLPKDYRGIWDLDAVAQVIEYHNGTKKPDEKIDPLDDWTENWLKNNGGNGELGEVKPS